MLEVLLLEQQARERRNQRPREQIGGEHGDDDAERERREQEAGWTFEEHDREEDDADGERGSEGRHGDLSRAVEDGDGERLPHVAVAVDVLHLDGGVVDQHADGEGEPAERHQIERLPPEEEADQTDQDGEGDAGADEHRAPPAAQEEEDHQGDEDRGDHRLVEDVGDGGAHEDGLIEVELQLHPFRRGGLDDGKLVAGPLDDSKGRGIRLLEDGEIGGAPAVDADEVLLHRVSIAHPGDVAEHDRRAIHRLDGEIVERLDGVGTGVELHVVERVADHRRAGGHEHVALQDRLHDVVRR